MKSMNIGLAVRMMTYFLRLEPADEWDGMGSHVCENPYAVRDHQRSSTLWMICG